MRTHRCRESLKNGVSIRVRIDNIGIKKLNLGWWLFNPEYDFDSDAYSLNPVCAIEFCPFCGKKLESEV